MKLTDKLNQLFIKEKFAPELYSHDDLEYEQEVMRGCGTIILSWVLIIVLILTLIKFL